MIGEWLTLYIEHYNWQALLVFFALLIAITKITKALLFKHKDIARMVEANRVADKEKKAKPKYPPMIKASNQAGMYTNAFFLFLVAPLMFSLETLPWWRYLTDIVLILLIYDFFYYLTHRFLFHGNAYFRRVHGVHHQARSPTAVDALYVHPLETFIGLALLCLTISGVYLWLGPLNAFSMAFLYLIYTQQNIINHVYFDLDFFPFKTVDYLTTKHQIHHENMNKGNYASLSPLYDWMFGTLE